MQSLTDEAARDFFELLLIVKVLSGCDDVELQDIGDMSTGSIEVVLVGRMSVGSSHGWRWSTYGPLRRRSRQAYSEQKQGSHPGRLLRGFASGSKRVFAGMEFETKPARVHHADTAFFFSSSHVPLGAILSLHSP
jgi:hypothetical protein